MNPIHYLSNPIAQPDVPVPYRAVPETSTFERALWSVVGPNGRKLKGGLMQTSGQGWTTYRDGVHVPGVDVAWLLTQQQ